MKKLTQKDFEHAPNWAKSAAVDKNGHGYYHSVTIDRLKNDGGQWWPNYHLDYSHYIMGAMTGVKKSGSIADVLFFDATDWQNSAINREC